MQFLEAQETVCDLLGIEYSSISQNGQFSLDEIKEAISRAAKRAWSYKKWDIKEGSKKITAIDTEYYDYPNDFVAGSIKILRVAGKKYDKLSYEAYQKHFEENSNSTDKYFAEYARFLFVNKNAYSVGDEIDAYGKKRSTKLSDDGDPLPFSPDSDDEENSGNDAIVLLAYSYLLLSSKKKNPSKARLVKVDAFEVLDEIWAEMDANRMREKNKGRPLFKYINFFQ